MIFMLLEHKVIQRLNHVGLQVPKSYSSLIQPSVNPSAFQKTRQILAESGKHWNILPSPLPHPPPWNKEHRVGAETLQKPGTSAREMALK